jgi:hypothetical protein
MHPLRGPQLWQIQLSDYLDTASCPMQALVSALKEGIRVTLRLVNSASRVMHFQVRVKSKFSIAAIQFPPISHFVRFQRWPRLRSSFKMIDSEISLMDLRRFWLSRCKVR